MQSLRSRFFIFLLKHRNLFKFKLSNKCEVNYDTSIPELRAKTEKAGMLFGGNPKDLEIVPEPLGELYAEWVLPFHKDKDKVILYFHGGGYVIGSALGHRPHVAKVVRGTGVSAFVFSYRLAPENPFPAALEDALKAYNHLLEMGVKPEKIAFMGDSAGGGLALATILALKKEKIGLPKACVTLSPWTDLKNTGESLVSNANVDSITWKESWTIFSEYYVKDANPYNPLISPLYGDLTGFPALMMFVGGDETLRDDTVRFAEKATAAGVDVKLRVGEKMIHCYPICAPMFPEATLALGEICEFIKIKLKNI